MNPQARPWRAIALLAGLVGVAHLLVLQALPRASAPPAAAASPAVAWTVRRIEPVAPPVRPDLQPIRPPARIAPAPDATKSIVSVAAPVPAAPMPAEAAALPSPGWDIAAVAEPMRLHYQATTASQPDAVGTARLDWSHDGARYQATLEIAAPNRAVRHQRSAGTLAAQGLAPERFGDRSRGEEAVHFDRAAGRLVFSANRPGAPLLPGAQDRLSVLLQLGGLLAAAPPQRLRPGAVLALQTAGTREAGVWRFTLEDEEDLQLPGGTVRAWRLVRPPRHEWDPRIEVWLAPGQAYAPVRLRLTPPTGDWLELQWLRTDKG